MDCASRKIFPAAFAAVILCSFLLCPCIASDKPEPPVLEQLRAKVSLQQLDSLELFTAKLELTDALKFHDLQAALVNSGETIELAIKLNNPGLLGVARMDDLFIRDQMFGHSEIDLEKQLSSLSTVSTLSPELQLHYFESKLAIDIWQHNTRADYLHPLKKIELAQARCNNHLLNAELRATRLYIFYYLLGAKNQNQETLAQLYQAVCKDAIEFPQSTAPIVCQLVQARLAAGERDSQKEKRSVVKALELSNTNGHRFYQIKSLTLISLIEIKKQDRADASAAMDSALNVADRLHSERLQFFLLYDLAKYKEKDGLWNEQVKCLQRITKSAIFKWSRMSKQNSIFRDLMLTHGQLGNSEEEHWKNQMADLSAVAQSRADHARISKLNANLNESKDLVVQAQHSIENLRWYLILTTVAILLSAPWLLLYVYRLRFRQVQNELDIERFNSLESQKQCEDLSVRISRMERMESLGLMAGCIAHDFNNILVGVLCNAEVLQMNDSFDDKQFVHKRVAAIVKSAEKAASLSAQMLAYAGRQDIARQNTDLNEIVRQYEPVLESVCKSSQRLVFRLDADAVSAKVDVTQIEQVVLNFVTNAVEASPDTGQITIRTGTTTIADLEDSSLFGKRTKGGDFCYVEVEDNGEGISESTRQKIFEPFYSDSSEGRGLGLSVVYGVINGHDGFVQCISDAGRGTIFRALVPQLHSERRNLGDGTKQDKADSKTRLQFTDFHEQQSASNPESATLAFLESEQSAHKSLPTIVDGFSEQKTVGCGSGLQKPSTNRAISATIPNSDHADQNQQRTILIIDDEETIIELCHQALAMVGCRVLSSQSGIEALEIITKNKEQIDCVLMDVVMPQMGANEILTQLETDRIGIPVILMSGFSSTSLEFFKARPNVVSFIQKPFRIADIQNIINVIAKPV